MSGDPQVAALRKIAEPESLHDTLLKKYNLGEKNAASLFTVRLMICGKKKEEEPVAEKLERFATIATHEANKGNAFETRKDAPPQIRSVLIDYGGEFMQLLEGPERCVYGYASELQSSKNVLSDVVVLFFEDDVQGFLPSGWLNIDKVPPACVGGNPPEKSDGEIADAVVHDLGNLRELGIAAGETDMSRRALFADNAKVNFPKLFPKSSIIEAYVESELFLSLSEFEESFCHFPNAPRESEVAHPVADPLRF